MSADLSPSIPPGTLVGRYRVLASVGTGAMGEVYRAEDTSLGRVVALKTLPLDLVGTPDRRLRFQNEGRVMASLSHPNLVQVFDVGEYEGTPYLVQEFVEGETLENVLMSGPVAAPKAARWIVQAAEGLAAVHDAGFLHRDIKPSNIMVDRQGRVRVLDFGLAKVQAVSSDGRKSAPSLTTDGFVVGTAQYMSPEQASGKGADARSDVFSLGAVFYELLSGRTPFEGETAVDVMYAILHLQVRPIPGFESGVLAGFAEVASTALAKAPEDRYPSMRDLAAELGFKRISVLTPAEHDHMIGYVSQLCHAIAVSLMCASDNSELANYTGDSFRDLTRIAHINDKMWAELFLWNKDNLISEIDMFESALQDMREKLVRDDREGLEEMFRLSTKRREAFDKK